MDPITRFLTETTTDEVAAWYEDMIQRLKEELSKSINPIIKKLMLEAITLISFAKRISVFINQNELIIERAIATLEYELKPEKPHLSNYIPDSLDNISAEIFSRCRLLDSSFEKNSQSPALRKYISLVHKFYQLTQIWFKASFEIQSLMVKNQKIDIGTYKRYAALLKQKHDYDGSSLQQQIIQMDRLL